jgi:arsenite methyltransferase
METTHEPIANRASLEALVEAGWLKLESLHPGGLDTTRELAELCGIQKGARVVDVASGTGETACFLAERLDARVFGVELSEEMIRKARAKTPATSLKIQFVNADASSLPLPTAQFDAAICECTLCLLEKERALSEMVRVVRPGGCIGIHDLCWKAQAPDRLKRSLAKIEGENPETLEGWQRLFAQAGLIQIKAVEKSALMSKWMKESRKLLGLTGQVMLGFKVIRRWGFQGLWRVLQSERIFASEFLGYGIVVGTKP